MTLGPASETGVIGRERNGVEEEPLLAEEKAEERKVGVREETDASIGRQESETSISRPYSEPL